LRIAEPLPHRIKCITGLARRGGARPRRDRRVRGLRHQQQRHHLGNHPGDGRDKLAGGGVRQFQQQPRRNRHAVVQRPQSSRSTTSGTMSLPPHPAWERSGWSGWFAGFGPISGPGKSDMVLRNTLSGAFDFTADTPQARGLPSRTKSGGQVSSVAPTPPYCAIRTDASKLVVLESFAPEDHRTANSVPVFPPHSIS
jgi:hypothetical protein